MTEDLHITDPDNVDPYPCSECGAQAAAVECPICRQLLCYPCYDDPDVYHPEYRCHHEYYIRTGRNYRPDNPRKEFSYE